MTIHSDHPFLTPEPDRNPVRRLRGRLASPVTLWTARPDDPVGLTVSSMLVADGDPPKLLALLDPDSDLWDALARSRQAAVSVLGWQHRTLADAFAGVAPAPGGAFRLTEWTDTSWGPVLSDASAWAGVRLVDTEPRPVGWALAVEAVLERAEVGEDSPPLLHRRGRYVRLAEPG
ncbi:MAG: flavin reductase family protein [Nocardioidaceae bacterium]